MIPRAGVRFPGAGVLPRAFAHQSLRDADCRCCQTARRCCRAFISGFIGCVAINPTDVNGNPRKQDSSSNILALNYNKGLFGSSPTWQDGDEIIFTDAVMIDGAGYKWLMGAREASPSYQMPDPNGGTYDATVGGHRRTGYARITFVGE